MNKQENETTEVSIADDAIMVVLDVALDEYDKDVMSAYMAIEAFRQRQVVVAYPGWGIA